MAVAAALVRVEFPLYEPITRYNAVGHNGDAECRRQPSRNQPGPEPETEMASPLPPVTPLDPLDPNPNRPLDPLLCLHYAQSKEIIAWLISINSG
jgi:hypothetical protein